MLGLQQEDFQIDSIPSLEQTATQKFKVKRILFSLEYGFLFISKLNYVKNEHRSSFYKISYPEIGLCQFEEISNEMETTPLTAA